MGTGWPVPASCSQRLMEPKGEDARSLQHRHPAGVCDRAGGGTKSAAPQHGACVRCALLRGEVVGAPSMSAQRARRHDLRGHRFGRLTAVEPARTPNRAGWRCICACGNVTTVATDKLLAKLIVSCGCWRKRRGKEAVRYAHGQGGKYDRTKEYRAWSGMINRCTNPKASKWPRYGGRGITVAPVWRKSFVRFLRDVGKAPGPKYMLERKNNERGYVPGNVCWATNAEQSLNRSSNRILTVHGEQAPAMVWARRRGIGISTILARIDRWGWSNTDAVMRPLRGAA
jgi:hypothetical protein